MGEIRLDNFCRLCLKESFTLSNIFSSHSPSGDLLYRVLNFVYDLKILPDDVLPPKICAPCLWKMLEFDTYKKNVHFAEAEIVKFLGETRLDSNNRNDEENDETAMESDSTQMVSIKEEFDIVEWEMPADTVIKDPEAAQQFQEADKDDSNDIESDEMEPLELPEEGYEEKSNDQVFYLPLQEWEKSELDASKSSKATPKVAQVETLDETKAVVQPAVATPPSTRSTTVNKISDEGLVTDEGPKKSKRLRSPGKSSQLKSNPPSPRRTRIVKVEKPSCDNSKQGPSSEKDSTHQSLSEHQSGAENKGACPFVCQLCGASYVRMHLLQKHVVAHRNEPTYTTSGQRLQSKRDLNSQKQFHSHVLPYSTRSSDLKNFPSLEASEETARTSFVGESSSICTSQDNSIEISDTNKTISENDLRADVVPEEESAGLSKSILNDTKSELSYLITPISKRKSGFICEVCKKSFPSKQNLGNHLRVHNELIHLRKKLKKIGFICDICKKSFKSKWNLGSHVRVHNDDRSFSCNKCDKTFRWDYSRYCHELRHMRDKISLGKSEEGNKKKQFSCTVCGKNFSSKKRLYYHSNRHTDKYKCNSCGRRFLDKSQLRSHLRTHTKEKPFKCGVCLKCFSTNSNLIRHLHIHSTERPFSCEICDKRFKSKQGKTEHELHHLRIK